jgi:hypothetical protein
MPVRRRWQPLALVFAAGVLLGVVGMATWVHHRLEVLYGAGPEGFDALALQVLDEHLDLDASQEERARATLRRVHQRLLAFHQSHGDELHGILAEAADQLQALLGPEQVADWGALHQRILTHLMISGSLHSQGDASAPPPAAPHDPGG